MKLYDPFAGREVEARRDPVSKRVVITKADTPATGTRSLEARTPDGRYASHANRATVLRVRVRHHPRSRLVEVHKALGAGGIPLRARALLRAGNVAGEAQRSAQWWRKYPALMAVAGADSARGMVAEHPIAATGAAGSAYLTGRRRGKKKALAAAPMTKSLLRGDPFGQRAPGVSHNRWSKANSSIPDAARHGRRLPEEERLRT